MTNILASLILLAAIGASAESASAADDTHVAQPPRRLCHSPL